MKRTERLICALSGVCLVACGSAPKARFPDAQTLLSRLDEQSSCSRGVQGEAKVAFRGEGRRLSANLLFLAEAPHSLRFDATHSVAGTIATLTTNGERFSLASLEEKRFYEGPARTCNVERFTRVPAPPSVFVDLLRNRAPRLRSKRSPSLAAQAPLFGDFHYEVTVTGVSETETLRLFVHPDDYDRPTSEQRLRLGYLGLVRAGRPVFEAELGEFRGGRTAPPVEVTAEERLLGVEPAPPGAPCASELPGFARFYVEETGFELTFASMELLHNPVLGAQAFLQERRPGLLTTPADCDDGESVWANPKPLATMPVDR